MPSNTKKFHFFDIIALATGGDVTLRFGNADLEHYDGSVRYAEDFEYQYLYELMEHISGGKIILSPDGCINEQEVIALAECTNFAIFEQCPWLDELFKDDENNLVNRMTDMGQCDFEESKEEYLMRMVNKYNIWHEIKPMPTNNVYRKYPLFQNGTMAPMGLN